MQCLILAGGLGTRMRSYTDQVPKALIDVAGRPFADHQLALLATEGINRVLFSIGHKGNMLRDYVGDGSRWGVAVSYVDEGEALRGTAGAVRLAMDEGFLDDGFFVLYGDSYLPIAMRPVWEASGSGAKPLMTVLKNEGKWDKSNVCFRDGQLRLYDKKATTPDMQYIDFGLSVLTRDAIAKNVPPSTVADLADLYHTLSLRRELAGYEVTQRFYEIGSPTGRDELEGFLNEAEKS